jgi:hypothetical protein
MALAGSQAGAVHTASSVARRSASLQIHSTQINSPINARFDVHALQPATRAAAIRHLKESTPW